MINRLVNSALIVTAGFVVMQTMIVNNSILTKTEAIQSEIQSIREEYNQNARR